MQQITIDELKASEKLPSPKGVALAIMRLMRYENVSREQITQVLKGDPAMSGRLIKAANTVIGSAARRIASVRDAVTVLGTNAVKNLALGFYLIANHRRGACERFDYQEFWSRSLLAAIANTFFAEPSRAAPAEELFACGMLSGIGQLALATVYPQRYSDLLTRWAASTQAELVALEKQEFGLDHDEITAELLSHWGMPPALVEPVRNAGGRDMRPFTEASRGWTLSNVLRTAGFFADMCLMDTAARARCVPELFMLAARIGLDPGATAGYCDRAVSEWQEWSTLVGVEARPMESFAAYAEQLPGGVRSAAPEADAESMRVLVVDDDSAVVAVLKRLLSAEGCAVNSARDGREGLAVAIEKRPHLVITDWMMPGMDGVSLTRALRERAVGQGMYVLMLTSIEDEERLAVAFEAGVDDYLVKPVKPRAVAARLRTVARMIRTQRALVAERDDLRRFVGELAAAQRSLRETALLDPLTGIPNRAYGVQRLNQEWAAAVRHRRNLAVMMVEIDFLKSVRDTYGEEARDMVLSRTVQTIRSALRTEDVLCRMGDEGLFLICPRADAAAAAICAERLRVAVEAEQISAGEVQYRTTLSVGIAVRTDTITDPACLLKSAERALYAAKEGGRNRCVVARSGGPAANGGDTPQ